VLLTVYAEDGGARLQMRYLGLATEGNQHGRADGWFSLAPVDGVFVRTRGEFGSVGARGFGSMPGCCCSGLRAACL